jgi:YggT family protein
VNNIALTLASSGRISAGFVVALALNAVWSAVSFLLGFCIVVIALRFIAYIIRANIYNPFWRIIASISEPILYRTCRTLFRDKFVPFAHGMIISFAALLALWALLAFGVGALERLVLATPLI